MSIAVDECVSRVEPSGRVQTFSGGEHACINGSCVWPETVGERLCESFVAFTILKVGDRETRDIPDIFALHPEEVRWLLYHDPEKARVDYTALSDEQLTVIARNREATALYAWEPYFHNPKLRQRLHRINVPTLFLWGAEDRFVSPGYYGAAYCAGVPGARLETIEGAGHYPHLEAPDAFVARVREFLDGRDA